MREANRAPQSILVSTGEEVTAIVTPVSICMALTVALVKTLNPDGRSDGRAVSIASVYYSEQVSCWGSGPTTTAADAAAAGMNANVLRALRSCRGLTLTRC